MNDSGLQSPHINKISSRNASWKSGNETRLLPVTEDENEDAILC